MTWKFIYLNVFSNSCTERYKTSKVTTLWLLEYNGHLPVYGSHLSGLFCIFDEAVETIINDLEVTLELSLSRNQPRCQRNFPVRNIECRTMLSFKKSTIYSLKYMDNGQQLVCNKQPTSRKSEKGRQPWKYAPLQHRNEIKWSTRQRVI